MNNSFHTPEFKSFCHQFSNEKRIIIYGASEFATTLNDILDHQVIAFIDKDKKKHNTFYLNKPVLDVINIRKLEYDFIIIAVVGREEELKKVLIENYNIQKDKIIYFKQIPDINLKHTYQIYKYEYQLIKNFFIAYNFTDTQYFIAPGYFLYDYNRCYPLEHSERLLEDFYIEYKSIEYIIIPKNFEIGFLLKQLLEYYENVYSNASYMVYQLKKKNISTMNFKTENNKRATLITTYNRPQFLMRTLTLLNEFDLDDIVVVDDCSSEIFQEQYNEIFEKFYNKITVIRNPKNRGLAYSLNVGFSYLLSDLSVKWISYFQDDITYIDKNLYNIYSKYENNTINPIITGYYGKEHPIIRTKKEDGIEIYFLKTTPGVHIHMHRRYINTFLPIPTHFLGAPKNKKHSHTDWWMSNWSLYSPLRQGTEILCIPNLVQTDLSQKNSTYRDLGEYDVK